MLIKRTLHYWNNCRRNYCISCRTRMDIFGVIIIACVTAIGGGSVRDVLLDTTRLAGLNILNISLWWLVPLY